ncbi:hypothetical protein BFW38_10710 [Terasakiispira papahanaumokuakeensis]|uniref:Uncharacterized protein n=1 Tax=Terasakiispira papahanaumokuakeensis TaxID=197479 RepID=A0A1E2VAA7_9GAMM|nr:hypothetical protein BFW38_10710 [Terasakiispira papahanaumokuakeensis]
MTLIQSITVQTLQTDGLHIGQMGGTTPATDSFAHKNAHKPESPHYDPSAANNTHIPIEMPEIWLMDFMKINSNGG